MLEIKNLSQKDLKETEAILKKFVPYAQKQLGYDQPVKLMFISDPDNATNPLGKTAHYQPGTKVVTIYVDERHPKDIMRSVSHELVHHAQNCRGEFDKTPAMGDGYAQADEHLREMEREAYEKGNLIFRDFEDGLKTNDKEMTIYIDDSSGEAPANLYEEKKMKKNNFGLNSPHRKWQAFLLNERTDKKKAAWMQAFQNAAGNPQPPPRDFWDTATYLYSKGDDPVEAGKQYAANNLNEYGDHETQARGGLVASGYSSEPSMDFVEDIARDVVDGGGSLMQIATALKDQGFDANVSSGVLMIQGTAREKFFIGKASNFDIDPNEETRQIGPYVLGFMDSSMNEGDSPKKDMGATGKDSHWMPEAHGAEHEETGGWGQAHGNAADEAPSREQALEAMVDLDKTVKNYLASSDEYAQKDGKDLQQIRNMFAKEFNGGASPGKFSQELKNAVSYLDTIIRDEIPQDLYYSLFPDMLEEGLTVDGKQLNVGDMVQVTGGGLTGATGEIIEFAEGKAVVRLETDADRPVFGKADDEVIVRGEHLALMGGMNEAEGDYSWSQTSDGVLELKDDRGEVWGSVEKGTGSKWNVYDDEGEEPIATAYDVETAKAELLDRLDIADEAINEAYQPWRGKRTMADLDKDAKTRETDFLKKNKTKKDNKDKQIKEMYGEDDDYFMELEKEFPFLSKAVKAGEVPEDVAAEIAKEYGDKDEMPSGEQLKESLRRVVKRVLMEKMDPVGKEDGDIDNDGDEDSSDKYLKKRREAVGKAMQKEVHGGGHWYEIYDEESGKTLEIWATSQEEAEYKSEEVDYDAYRDGQAVMATKNMAEELKGGQKKLDTDGDGDIGADDLANLRDKKKAKNEVYSKRAVLEAVIRKTLVGEEIDPSQFPNPLPKDMSGEKFLSKGMRDGSKGDDVVQAGGKSIAAQDAKPSQSAIYLGKALGMAVGGVKGGNINALISADNYILDGHHRWAATMFADPSAAISGTGIGMPMTELIPVLRAAGDAYGNARRGEPAGGDVNIFKASLEDAKQAIQKIDGGTKFTKPGAAAKWLESIGGEAELSKRLDAIKAKGAAAASAPPRNEMPVIDADKGDDKNVALRLNKGAIDVKPPYADDPSAGKKKEPRAMNESRKNRVHNEKYDLLMERMLGIKPITPLSSRNNWLLEEEGKDEEDDSKNPMGYCDERQFMSAQEAEKEKEKSEKDGNYSESEIEAMAKHPKDLKNN